jgi:trehalose/maltose hydrolase-like predicted phosphorylase
MGATVLIVLKAYAGLTFENGQPRVNGALPAQWRRINFKITYRGQNYAASISRENAEIHAE